MLVLASKTKGKREQCRAFLGRNRQLNQLYTLLTDKVVHGIRLPPTQMAFDAVTVGSAAASRVMAFVATAMRFAYREGCRRKKVSLCEAFKGGWQESSYATMREAN